MVCGPTKRQSEGVGYNKEQSDMGDVAMSVAGTSVALQLLHSTLHSGCIAAQAEVQSYSTAAAQAERAVTSCTSHGFS